MHITDLLFLVCALTAIGAMGRIIYLLIRRNLRGAARTTGRLAIAVAAYFLILIVVSLVSPGRVLAMRERRCFDDWCIQVTGVEQAPEIGDVHAAGRFYMVRFEVLSDAKRVTQRALDVHVWLLDDAGHRFGVSATGQGAFERTRGPAKPFDMELHPGEAFETTRVFDVPASIRGASILIEHGTWPGRLIIGASQSFLHAPTLVKLEM